MNIERMNVDHRPPDRGGGATISGVVREAARRLGAGGIAASRLEAEVLAGHILGCSRAVVLARGREAAPRDLTRPLGAMIDRRLQGFPLQHLTGVQEFWSLSFRVDGRVLIPRPETELLVEEGLRRLEDPGGRVVDVGTGSGCVAVAFAREKPGVTIIAIDRSADALELARANARRLVPDVSIRWLEGDLLGPLDREGIQAVDLIASNPPYVATAEMAELPREVRDHEPHEALHAGTTGLEVMTRLIAAAGSRLRPGGDLVMEMGAGQWPAVRDLVLSDGRYGPAEVREDFQGIPRVVGARRRSDGSRR